MNTTTIKCPICRDYVTVVIETVANYFEKSVLGVHGHIETGKCEGTGLTVAQALSWNEDLQRLSNAYANN